MYNYTIPPNKVAKVLYMVMAYITNQEGKRKILVLDTIRAGISLTGVEVKSIRNGMGSLQGARVLIRGNEMFLVGATIPPYQANNTPSNYEPARNRRLLVSKRECRQLLQRIEAKNLTLVPIAIYNVGRNLKIDVALSRKKLGRDKREDIQKKEARRAIRRSLKK